MCPLINKKQSGNGLVNLDFKDIFGSGITIKLSLKQDILNCRVCEINEHWEKYDIEINRCPYHTHINTIQTSILDFT